MELLKRLPFTYFKWTLQYLHTLECSNTICSRKHDSETLIPKTCSSSKHSSKPDLLIYLPLQCKADFAMWNPPHIINCWWISEQLYWNRTLARVFSCKFAAYFQEHLFLRTPLGGCFCNLHLWNVKIWLKASNFCSGWHIYVKRMGFYSISNTTDQ